MRAGRKEGRPSAETGREGGREGESFTVVVAAVSALLFRERAVAGVLAYCTTTQDFAKFEN